MGYFNRTITSVPIPTQDNGWTIGKKYSLKATSKITLGSFHFSSSANMKIRFCVNKNVIATMFINQKNLQSEYSHPVNLNKGDVVIIYFENRDVIAADAYISFKKLNKLKRVK